MCEAMESSIFGQISELCCISSVFMVVCVEGMIFRSYKFHIQLVSDPWMYDIDMFGL